MLPDALSQADKALFDTLITRAQGAPFDWLAQMSGVPRLGSIPQKHWRKALRHVLYGQRGSVGNTYAFLREALRGFDKTYVVNLDKTAAQFVNKVIWVAGGPGGGFRKDDLFRLWEVDGKVYFSDATDDPAGNEPWAFIRFCPVGTPYWRRCQWFLDYPDEPNPFQRTVTKLPFVYREYDGKYELFVSDDVDPVPGSYLQELYLWGATVGTVDAAGWSSWPCIGAGNNYDLNGGYAPTAVAPGTPVAWAAPEDMTLRYLRAEADYGAVPARGGAHAVTLQKNGADTALTCSLGAAANSASDLANSVAVSKGDLLRIKVVSDNNVTTGLRSPRFAVSEDRPSQEPFGGQLLPSAATAGNPSGAGPYPIYLSDDTLESWASRVRLLLAAGVQGQAKLAKFKAPW